jgi:nitrile hydratase
MNSVHDVGGMDGFGPVEAEENEPVFHEAWEGRVFALIMFGLARWEHGRSSGNLRFELESLPPADYLCMSYYERWLTVNVSRLLRSGLVTESELETGRADPDRPAPVLVSPSDTAATGSGPLDMDVPPRFGVRDEVRARNLHPRGHTRLPRYTRGKRGIVIRDNGVYALQDTDEDGQLLGYNPQHVYTVGFTGEELWGDRASPRDIVHVDLWEDYLEQA